MQNTHCLFITGRYTTFIHMAYLYLKAAGLRRLSRGLW